MAKVNIGRADQPSTAEPELIYETNLGQMFCGDTHAFLDRPEGEALSRQVQLVFTSPPFPLNEKKKYGNLQGEEYIEWFAGFAPKLADLLRQRAQS